MYRSSPVARILAVLALALIVVIVTEAQRPPADLDRELAVELDRLDRLLDQLENHPRP